MIGEHVSARKEHDIQKSCINNAIWMIDWTTIGYVNEASNGAIWSGNWP